ncbi:hypothetical protein [Streptomyces bauhiniae]
MPVAEAVPARGPPVGHPQRREQDGNRLYDTDHSLKPGARPAE